MASETNKVQFYFQYGVYPKHNEKLWRWRLIGKNGRIIVASSEAFDSRPNSVRNFKLTVEILSNSNYEILGLKSLKRPVML